MRAALTISALGMFVVACGSRFRFVDETDSTTTGDTSTGGTGVANGGNTSTNAGGGGAGGGMPTENCVNGIDDDGDGATDCDDTDCAQECSADAFVDDNAAPGGDGSLDHPYDDIAKATPVCNGTPKTIFVFAGEYGPFVLPPSCIVVGEAVETVVVRGLGDRCVTVPDGGAPAAGLTRMTLTDGFTTGKGGCLAVDGGGLDVSGVTMTSCAAGEGGGLHIEDGQITAVDVTIANSTATRGAGLAVVGGQAHLGKLLLHDNAASDAGGGVYISDDGIATFSASVIGPNNTAVDGGGIHQRSGNSELLLGRCSISGNTASARGGGIFHDDGELNITNTFVTDNTANAQFGGIHQKGGAAVFTHVTIAGNSAPTAPGGIGCTGGDAPLHNVLIWGNQGGGSLGCAISTSLVQGDACCGNISSDPFFVDAGNGNYHLMLGSPAIGIGDPITSNTMDFDGDARDGAPDAGADEAL